MAWSSESGFVTIRTQHMLEVFMKDFVDGENIQFKPLEKLVFNECRNVDRYWSRVNRWKSDFPSKHSEWLNVRENVHLCRSVSVEQYVQDNSRGRLTAAAVRTVVVLKMASLICLNVLSVGE